MKKQVVGDMPGTLDYSLNDWEKYFREIHQLKTDFAGVRIPKADNKEDDNEFSWFGCIPENFSTERAYSGGKKLYPKWKSVEGSLDNGLELSFGRDSQKSSYIVRFRANWEADDSEAGLSLFDTLEAYSAYTIWLYNINTSTLKERLLLGDFLYWKYKKHLDVTSTTLCSGSRYLGYVVASVNWCSDHGELSVMGYDSEYFSGGLRAREVVSC